MFQSTCAPRHMPIMRTRVPGCCRQQVVVLSYIRCRYTGFAQAWPGLRLNKGRAAAHAQPEAQVYGRAHGAAAHQVAQVKVALHVDMLRPVAVRVRQVRLRPPSPQSSSKTPFAYVHATMHAAPGPQLCKLHGRSRLSSGFRVQSVDIAAQGAALGRAPGRAWRGTSRRPPRRGHRGRIWRV